MKTNCKKNCWCEDFFLSEKTLQKTIFITTAKTELQLWRRRRRKLKYQSRLQQQNRSRFLAQIIGGRKKNTQRGCDDKKADLSRVRRRRRDRQNETTKFPRPGVKVGLKLEMKMSKKSERRRTRGVQIRACCRLGTHTQISCQQLLISVCLSVWHQQSPEFDRH